jgi:hypothetical protein
MYFYKLKLTCTKIFNEFIPYFCRSLYVSSNVTACLIRRRRGTDESKRQKSLRYFLKTETGSRIQVCKVFFLTTLGYHKKMIELFQTTWENSSLFNEFVCKLGHECQKRPNLHTNELNTTFFCSTSLLKAPNSLKSLKLA